MICNRCAWAHFSSFRYRFDLKIPCHVVTELVLSTQPFVPMCTVSVPPREYHSNEVLAALEADGCEFVENLAQHVTCHLSQHVAN